MGQERYVKLIQRQRQADAGRLYVRFLARPAGEERQVSSRANKRGQDSTFIGRKEPCGDFIQLQGRSLFFQHRRLPHGPAQLRSESTLPEWDTLNCSARCLTDRQGLPNSSDSISNVAGVEPRIGASSNLRGIRVR